MAPNLIGNTFLLAESTIDQQQDNKVTTPTCPVPTVQSRITKKSLEVQPTGKNKDYELEVVWRNVIAFIILHAFALYGVWISITEKTVVAYIWGHIVGMFAAFGITAGAHRLWAHRSYKAKWPLRIILMILQTVAFQNSIYEWVRDHRVHHKYTDTNADPHNAKRGFFFSHMGWLLCKKHPDVKAKGKCVDMTDLDADPIVVFQKKYYFYLMPVFCFVLPALIPYFYFGISFRDCFFVCSIMRYVISLHCTWLVNSAAHMYGMRPYDKYIGPTNSKSVAMVAYGEGWHNYHHVFPWDYKTAELGHYQYNLTTMFIDFFVKIGWAYDLKTVSYDMIIKRVERTGDGSHEYSKKLKNKSENELIQELNDKCNHEDSETMLWGWDDPEMPEQDKREAKIINKEKES